MMDQHCLPRDLRRACPHCGSLHTRSANSICETGAVVGGVIGTVIAAVRIGSKSTPVVTSVLIAGALAGMLLGARTGWTIGTHINEFCGTYRCNACGAEFNG